MKGITRWTALLLTMMLAVTLFAFPAGKARADEVRFGVTYKSDTVNLRQRPTQSSSWLGAYKKDSWMAITGESGNWYYVTAPDGKTGYMSKNYVSVSPVSRATIGIVSNPKETSFLNLRQKPSYDAKVLGIYYNGVPCVILSYTNGWYNVRVNGVTGYFREEFISKQPLPYSEEVATIVTPNNTGLNLRTGPGMGYPSQAQFRGGKYVMVLQKGEGWWKVAIDGYVGFMNVAFLREGILSPNGAESESANTAPNGTGYAIVSNPRSTQVLNLRENPTTTSRVLGQYRSGTRVTVLRQGTEWCKVINSEHVVGYMMTDYLTLHNLPATPTMKVNHPQHTFVNLRSTPSMEGSVAARIPHGSSVTVLAPGDGWVKIRYKGQTGYAVAYFLQ